MKHKGNIHNMGPGKLTRQDVMEIHRLWMHPNPWTQTELAREFRVSQPMISSIVNGRTWRHLFNGS